MGERKDNKDGRKKEKDGKMEKIRIIRLKVKEKKKMDEGGYAKEEVEQTCGDHP